MGAWGHGTFENDDALDWVAELESSGLVAIEIETALDIVIAGPDSYIEAPDCCNALAAAEVVAAMHGRPAPDLPHEVSEWISRHGTADAALGSKAALAAQRVLEDSELRELWDESDDSAQWQEAVADLLARLN